MEYQTGIEFAREMDRQDPLSGFRDRFHIPRTPEGKETIYFCGNSLGLQPKSVRKYVEQELKDWENLGVEGHFHAKNPWMPYHEFLTESTARLVGAQPNEVVVMNALTVNLHLMMVTFYRPTKERFKIVIEGNAFPSDQYAVRSQLKFHGIDPEEGLIVLRSKSGNPVIPTEEIEEIIAREGDSIALILIGGVNYYSGQAFDLPRIVKAGHAKGCVVGFDLAHAAGNLHLHLHDWNVDFAAWCSYKYLNSGPGGVSAVYIHERHGSNTALPRFAGWWGHDKNSRFKMPDEFVPMPTAEAWQMSNAPILPMATLRASMEIFDEAGMAALRAKSEKLSAYLYWLLQPHLERLGINLITPSDPAQRGCQLSLQTSANGRQIFDRLEKNGVICDWREPDVIRIAAVPLYNSFEDCWRFVEILKG
ncbi:MAG: kynureninase [Bacteroidia bacterium]|nr:kynureninase [Bacteroidia bacterium]